MLRRGTSPSGTTHFGIHRHGMKNFAASSTFKRATPSDLVTLFCCCECGKSFREIEGDKIGALQYTISLKAKGSMLIVAREVAWRRVRHWWRFRCEHLPAESNTIADSLSRLSEVPAKPFASCFVHGPCCHKISACLKTVQNTSRKIRATWGIGFAPTRLV